MAKPESKIFIGTAGWSIPSSYRVQFAEVGTHLERYALQLNAVEINSSFHREHQAETYLKWAKSVPKDFAFSAKLLRYFTQEMRMKETGRRLKDVLEDMSALGPKWRVLLLQLPPSLEFNLKDSEKFLSAVRKTFSGQVVWEPRNQSWISETALDFIAGSGTSKVLADPDRCFLPFSKRKHIENTVYFRLHGQPQMYKSAYSSTVLQKLSQRLTEAKRLDKEAWCMFDNTTLGHATGNALELKQHLEKI